MSETKRPEQKQQWRMPEIIDVGCVFDLTEGMDTNVRDNQGTNPPKYALKITPDDAEVDLEGR